MDTLTREQEVQAFTLIRRPDGEQAKAIFIYFNQPLVGWIAKRYLDKGLSWEELLSAGNVGLVQAVNRFDPSKGTKFSTFAVPWIAGEIKQLFASSRRQKQSDRNIRMSDGGVAIVDSVPEEEESEVVDGAALENDSTLSEDESEEDGSLKDTTDLQEAAAQDVEAEGGLGMNPRQARSEGIGNVAGCAEFSASLRGEDPSYDGKPGGGYAINFAPDWSMCDTGADEYRPAIEQAIQRLKDPRRTKVLAMHMGLLGHKQHTFAEIGQALAVTTQRAHAIQRESLMQLRNDPTLQMFFDLLT